MWKEIEGDGEVEVTGIKRVSMRGLKLYLRLQQ